MTICAYCHQDRILTREHVIPRWYSYTPGDAETFNARSPISQVKGDLVIKDVCAECNSNHLGALDNYGKYLYDQYFERPVFAGESVKFTFDRNLLMRWLLKLCYNSARVHKADTQILSQFSMQILGKEPLTNHVRIFLNLIVPTRLKPSPSPASRADLKHHDIYEPHWFRITQFRLYTDPRVAIVQRQVIINSFAFTVFAVPPDSSSKYKHLKELSREFTKTFPKTVLLGSDGEVIVRTGDNHAFSSIAPLWQHYPNRFLEFNDRFISGLHTGKEASIIVRIPIDLIDNQNIKPVVKILREMVATRENAAAYQQRIALMVDGFDSDSRAIWQIPKAQQFLRILFIACPFMMFLSQLDGNLLKLLAACWIYEENQSELDEKHRLEEFLKIAFEGLNNLTHQLALSAELNKKVSTDAITALFDES